MSKSAQAFRTIREVADWLDVAAHVLRFWESKFPQIKPVKRAGGRRYYRPADMQLIGGIKVLLHDQGYTIRGVQKLIRNDGVDAVSALSPPLDQEEVEADSVVLEDAVQPVPEQPAAEPEYDLAEGIGQPTLPFDDEEPAIAAMAPATPTEADAPAEVEDAPIAAETVDLADQDTPGVALAMLADLARQASAPTSPEAHAKAQKALDDLRDLAARISDTLAD